MDAAEMNRSLDLILSETREIVSLLLSLDCFVSFDNIRKGKLIK